MLSYWNLAPVLQTLKYFPRYFLIYFQFSRHLHISPNISNSPSIPQIFSHARLNLLASNVFLKYSPKNLRILFQVFVSIQTLRCIVSIICESPNTWIYPQIFIKYFQFFKYSHSSIWGFLVKLVICVVPGH